MLHCAGCVQGDSVSRPLISLYVESAKPRAVASEWRNATVSHLTSVSACTHAAVLRSDKTVPHLSQGSASHQESSFGCFRAHPCSNPPKHHCLVVTQDWARLHGYEMHVMAAATDVRIRPGPWQKIAMIRQVRGLNSCIHCCTCSVAKPHASCCLESHSRSRAQAPSLYSAVRTGPFALCMLSTQPSHSRHASPMI